MKKKWLLVTGAALMLVAVGLAGCGAGTTAGSTIEGISISSQQEGIVVSGLGKVSAAPDIATLRLGIEAQEAGVGQAQDRASEAMDRVMAALTENGVAKKDIQTARFSIRQVTKWDRTKEEETVVGYRVTNMVTAKIRDIDKAGSIIDAVAKAGGDLTRVDSISFSVDDPSAYYEEARGKAMSEAKEKAQQLAKLAGVTLGKPTYISEGIQLPRPVYQAGAMYEEMERAAAVEMPISPGEMEITLTVQVVYAIAK